MHRVLFIILIFTFGVSCEGNCFSRSNCDLKIGNKCFVYIKESVNWFDAENCCVAWEGHLASIDSYTENMMLDMILDPDRFTWIGLKYITGNNKFEWTDGTTTSDYDNRESLMGQADESCYYSLGSSEYWIHSECNITTIGNMRSSYICKNSIPDAPQNLTATNVTSNSIQICFYPPPCINQNGPISSFNISYQGMTFDVSKIYYTLNVNPVYPLREYFCTNLTGLQEYNNYTITVSTVNSAGTGSESTSITQLTEQAAPSTPPLNISIESLNSSAIRVDWEPPKPIHHNGIITEYEIQYYEMHQNITLKIINNSANKLFEVMTNLDSNVSYCVAIRVATIAGVSERSSPVCTFTDSIPKIITPSAEIIDALFIVIESISCVATGKPTPEVYWTQNLETKLTDSDTLQVEISDLREGNNVFYCVAHNHLGRDVVSVTYKLSETAKINKDRLEMLTKELDEVEFITEEIAQQSIALIETIVNLTIANVEGEDESEILEIAVNAIELILKKSNHTLGYSTTSRITHILSSVRESAVSAEYQFQHESEGQAIVATASTLLVSTLNTLETFSTRLIEELEANSGEILTVNSEFITIIVQKLQLCQMSGSDSVPGITLPKGTSDVADYPVSLLLPVESVGSQCNQTIATSIVKMKKNDTSTLDKSTLGSDILTVTLANKSKHSDLDKEVTFTFDVYSNTLFDSICVFLNGTSWVSNGLTTIEESSNLTNCISPHLTSFAVLVTPQTVNIIKDRLEMLTEELDEVEFITEEITQQSIAIIETIVNSTIANVEGEDESEILERAVNAIELILKKSNHTLGYSTTSRIIGILSSVRESAVSVEYQFQNESEGQAIVATAPTLLVSTLNTLETFSTRLFKELETNSSDILIVNSEFITIIVQKVQLCQMSGSDSVLGITLPKRTSDVADYSASLLLPVKSVGSQCNLTIATSIVKMIKNDTSTSDKSVLGSDILTVAFESESLHSYLDKEVTFTFDVYSNTLFDSICVFLNDTSWVSNGLTTIEENSNLTNCISPHLTSFAVLVTPRRLGGNDDLQRVASIFSYIVVSISFLALLLSLILFIYTGKSFFKVEANIVYFNYCLSLTLAFGMFLFGIETATFNGISCKVIAFLLHYIWLTVFVWTLCNGILILYKLTLGIWNKHKIYIYLIVFGWCFPIIIPIITIAIKHGKYVKTDEHCFLTHEDGIIWAFIGPIIFILLINIIILIISVVRISTTKYGSERLQERQVIKNALISSIILTPILGIPWILLLLNILITDPIIQLSFILTNGLMGVFYFFAVTVRNEEVKQKFRKSKIYNVANMSNTLFSNTKSTGACNKFHSTTSSSIYSNSDTLRNTKTHAIDQKSHNDLPKSLPRAIKPNKTIGDRNRNSEDDASSPKKEPFDALAPKDEVFSNLGSIMIWEQLEEIETKL